MCKQRWRLHPTFPLVQTWKQQSVTTYWIYIAFFLATTSAFGCRSLAFCFVLIENTKLTISVCDSVRNKWIKLAGPDFPLLLLSLGCYCSRKNIESLGQRIGNRMVYDRAFSLSKYQRTKLPKREELGKRRPSGWRILWRQAHCSGERSHRLSSRSICCLNDLMN